MNRLIRYGVALAAFSLASSAARRVASRGKLRGKVVVVTGASSGVGRAVTLECAARGAHVVLAARHRDDLDRVAAEVRELGAEALVVPTDVRDRAQVNDLVRAATQWKGHLDVMVNNAGMAVVDTVEHTDEHHVRQMIDVNVMGVLYGSQAAAAVMRTQGAGHIINMTSIAGTVGFPMLGIYSGTKGFVQVMTQSLRLELMRIQRTGVKVSAVCPVVVRTPFHDKVPNVSRGGRGDHLVRPVLEPTAVGRAVADCIERYREVVYPLAPTKSLVVLNHLLPAVTDTFLRFVQPDRHVPLVSHEERGTHRDEDPIPPSVHGGELRG